MTTLLGEQPNEELFHVELNPQAAETIVFLHGLLETNLEYAEVIPHLDQYHLILVDTNGHGKSASIGPFTVQAAADNVASLIHRKAKGGVHLVGLSMGGFITLELSRRYPELVKSAFVTGAAPFEGFFKWMASNPSYVWYFMKVTILWPPEWLYRLVARMRGMRPHKELHAAMKQNVRWEVVRDVYTSILKVGWEDLRAIRVRTLTVAGGAEDDVGCTRRSGPLFREGGSDTSKAVLLKGGIHPWDLQYPELFAECVKAWIEGRELPKELVAL